VDESDHLALEEVVSASEPGEGRGGAPGRGRRRRMLLRVRTL